jgi:hypothetical protein
MSVTTGAAGGAEFVVHTQAGPKPSSMFKNDEIARCNAPSCREFVHVDYPPEWRENITRQTTVLRFCSRACSESSRQAHLLGLVISIVFAAIFFPLFLFLIM